MESSENPQRCLIAPRLTNSSYHAYLGSGERPSKLFTVLDSSGLTKSRSTTQITFRIKNERAQLKIEPFKYKTSAHLGSPYFSVNKTTKIKILYLKYIYAW